MPAGLTDPVERLRAATLAYSGRPASHRREALVVNRDTARLDEPHRAELPGRRRAHEHALRQVIIEGVTEPSTFSIAVSIRARCPEFCPVIASGHTAPGGASRWCFG